MFATVGVIIESSWSLTKLNVSLEFYRRLDLEQYDIDYLADLPNDESKLKKLYQ